MQTKMLWGPLVLSLAMLTTACATPSTLLVNNDGKVIRCSSSGWGAAGATTAVMSERGCVSDAKRLGYVELPALRLGFILDSQSKPPTVREVERGLAAQAAGVLVGDRLLQLDGTPIQGVKDVVFVISQKKAGDKIDFLIERNGERQTLTATIPPG